MTFELRVTCELWVTFQLGGGGQTHKETNRHKKHQYHDLAWPICAYDSAIVVEVVVV